MKPVLFRLLGYCVAGISLGAALKFSLLTGVAANSILLTIILVPAAAGVVVSVLLLMRAGAVIPQGVRINSAWTVAAMDGVCLIASASAWFFIIDGYSKWLTGSSPLVMDDRIALDVVAVMYLPSALILALFVTSSGSQTIAIDEAGLIVAGSFGADKAGWSEIERLSADEQYVVVSRLGIPIPRHLRTNLEIATGDGDVFTVYQPGLKSTAKIILEQFREHAPPRLHQDLDKMEAAWR